MARSSDLWSRFETALTKQDYEGFISLFSEDATYLEPGGRHEGRKGIQAWLDDWGHSFSDTRFEASLVIDDGDVIMAEWTYRCVHTGPLTMPDGSVIPASGRTMDSPGVTILHVKDGQIVGARDYFDQMDGMVQLGLMPGV